MKEKDFALTQEALDRLLGYLNADREIAGDQFELIRTKLITFFECRGCPNPEDYTDITIYRVARILSEGVEIYTNNPPSFFRGVARKVFQESWDDPSVKFIPLDDPSISRHISQDPIEVELQESQRLQHEQELECLERCLKNIPFKNRNLILRYYQGETSVKIKNRKQLAAQIGITMNALALKALRIREKLEDCVSNCVQQSVGT
jgi:hypothetical protein